MGDLIDTILPARDVHVVVGAVGSGKEVWMMQTVAAWAQGNPVLGYASHPAPFVYVSCLRTVEQLLYAARKLRIHAHVQPLLSTIEQEIETFDGLLEHTAAWQPVVYWIEGLQDCVEGDENRRRDVSRFLKRVKRECQRRGITVIGTVDEAKVVGRARITNVRERPQGSVAFGSHVGTQFNIARVSQTATCDVRRRLLILPRMGHDQEVLYTVGEEGGFLQQTMLVEGDAFTTMDLLLGTLPCQEDLHRDYLLDYANSCGVSARSADRWLSERIAGGKLERVNRGVYRRCRETIQ